MNGAQVLHGGEPLQLALLVPVVVRDDVMTNAGRVMCAICNLRNSRGFVFSLISGGNIS